jgi:hypothetical protein
LKGSIGILLGVLLSACNGVSVPTTSPAGGGPATIPGSATTVISATSTSMITTPTTSIAVVELPLAEPGSPEWQVLYSIPVGPEGVTYEGGFEDWMLTGPQALSVGPDESFWIADTNGRRLLHFGEDGSRLATIDTDLLGVAGLIDLAASGEGVWGLELLPALDRHRIVLFDDEGELVRSHDLPTDLHLEDGLSGIAAGSKGQLWIELEGGARVYTAFDSAGEFGPEAVQGYEIRGVVLRPAAVEGGMAQFQVGERVVQRPVREQGGITFEGAIPGWAALLVSDVALDESGALTVDLEVLYTDFEGNITAKASYPLHEVAADAYVPQDFIAVAPDGRLIAMKPTPDSLDIVELSLFEANGD